MVESPEIKAAERSTRTGQMALLPLLAVLVGTLLSGCSGVVLDSEFSARKKFTDVSQAYRPSGEKPPLPNLRVDSTLEELLTFGILNDPAVEAAYYDWQASVAHITTARSLPDPKLTFEADIADTVMSLMAGFMFDLPGPGKRSAMGEMASAESQGKFYAFKRSVLSTAAAIKNAYYSLQALEDSIVVNNRGLELLRDLEDIARAQHETGKVTLQDVLRAEIEREKLLTETQNLADSRVAVHAALRGALGIDPRLEVPIPTVFTNSTDEIAHEEILARAFEYNPLLKQMHAEIGKADNALRLARLSVVPDIGMELDIDTKASPVMFNPQLSITLPIWRDKIAAQIGAAQSDSNAARARFSREQINLAVDFASMLYMYRESSRNLKLFSEKLLPKASRSVEVARSGYIGGKSSFIDFLEAERTLLEFEFSRIETRVLYERAITNLSLVIGGQVPSGASFINDKEESVKE